MRRTRLGWAVWTCANLDTTAVRCGPKSEIRNPKPETNSNAQWSKAKNRQQGSGLGHSLLGAWGLIRASSFGFRVSALWMPVVPRCAPIYAWDHLLFARLGFSLFNRKKVLHE